MTTRLDRPLKRAVMFDGSDDTLAIGPDGLRLTGKGKRKAQVELRWVDLLNGDAALATALNASLSMKRAPGARRPATAEPDRRDERPSTKRRR